MYQHPFNLFCTYLHIFCEGSILLDLNSWASAQKLRQLTEQSRLVTQSHTSVTRWRHQADIKAL